MSAKNKNHNRIIFLTTLSVYLGLVLVGATPAALSQAAMTRQFDIKSEIEYKDDLDNKPDGNPNFQAVDIASALTAFLKDLQNLRANEPASYEQEKNFYARRKRVIYPGNLLELESPAKESLPSELEESFERLFNSLDNKSLQSLADFLQEKSNDKPVKRISFEIYPSLESSAKLLISFKKDSSQKASLLADQLEIEFRFRANKAGQNSAKTIYENTKAFAENNQVFIVTRLPRAAIDEFLAANAR